MVPAKQPKRRTTDPPAKPNELPHWEDDPVRKLTYLGRPVKHLGQPSPIQQLVFREFQKRGWRCCIENILDMLPRKLGRNAKRYLSGVIQNLNRNQHFRGIEFYADGTGRHLCWRPTRRATAVLLRESS